MCLPQALAPIMQALSQIGTHVAANSGAYLNAAQAATTVATTGVQYSEQKAQAAATADAAERQMEHSQAEATAALREKTATAAARGESIAIEGAEAAGQLRAFGYGESDRTLAALLHRQGGATARAQAGLTQQQRFARQGAAYAKSGAHVNRATTLAQLVRPTALELGLDVAAQTGHGVVGTLEKLKRSRPMTPAAIRSPSEGIA